MTTPEPRWTAETAALVADYLDDYPHTTWASSGREAAAAVLTKLADAGLLLPPGGEVQKKWRDYDTVSGGSVELGSLADAVKWHEKYSRPATPFDPPPHPTVTQVCTITTWPDGSTLTSPWCLAEVPS